MPDIMWELGRMAQITLMLAENQPQLWDNVREVTVEFSSAEADVTSRMDGGVRRQVTALREITITVTALYSSTDPCLAKCFAAWEAEPPDNVVWLTISAPVMNYNGPFMVTSINVPQPIDDIMTAEVVLKPTRLQYEKEE